MMHLVILHSLVEWLTFIKFLFLLLLPLTLSFLFWCTFESKHLLIYGWRVFRFLFCSIKKKNFPWGAIFSISFLLICFTKLKCLITESVRRNGQDFDKPWHASSSWGSTKVTGHSDDCASPIPSPLPRPGQGTELNGNLTKSRENGPKKFRKKESQLYSILNTCEQLVDASLKCLRWTDLGFMHDQWGRWLQTGERPFKEGLESFV